MTPDLSQPWQPVLDYWFGDGLESGWPSGNPVPFWFQPGAGDDAEVAHRFTPLVEAALARGLLEWERQGLSRLALIVLLDQFTRQIHRGTAQAFAGDHRAATLAVEGLSRGMETGLPWCGRLFFYMPLMHTEDVDLQTLAVEQISRLADQAPASLQTPLTSSVKSAKQHREIILRFGRFPHRNRILDRESSADELAYLENAPRFGQ